MKEAEPVTAPRKAGTRARAGVLAAAFLLAGCAATPPKTVDTFPVSTAQRTLEKGYRQVSDRYIEEVSVEALAMDGLQALARLEDELGIVRKGETVVLSWEGETAETYPAPAPGDAEGWARLTIEMLMAGRRLSPGLRRAPAPRLYKSLFNGMLSGLDSFSRYADADKATENRAKRSGFGGIGVRFRMQAAGALVSHVFESSPAARARLRKDDVITHAAGEPLAGLDARQVRKILRGAIDSVITLRIRRAEKESFRLQVKRARIVLPTVVRQPGGTILHFRVTGFNRRTSHDLAQMLHKAKRELKGRARGVLLDLRGNPGGLLSQAIRVSDLFLARGRIVSTRGRHPDSAQDYDARSNDIAKGLPIAVLVDGKSASAAEIVASALQDQRRAVVIGSSSFGKGTVQTVTRLPNEGEITLTWSRFVTPSGYVLHGLGVPPAVCTSTGRGGAARLVSETLGRAHEASLMAEAWRDVAYSNAARRKRLRATCPVRSGRSPLDLEVADLLLRDRDLYERVKRLSATENASRN